MKKSAIETAKSLMARRDFGKAIKVLQSRSENYEESFDYYCTLGTACLYIGDAGSANYNFECARKIKMNDVSLLLGQAAIFLRRGDTERAVQYYLDILDFEPQCKTAKNALEFIRVIGVYETICKWVDSGKIEHFYPPLKFNPKVIFFILLAAVCGIFFGILITDFIIPKNVYKSERADLTSLALTVDEKKFPKENSLMQEQVHYILSDKQIKESYDKAQICFHEYNDNGAQVEINRIINSNAASGIQHKARLLMGYLKEPAFDSLKENFSIEQVNKDPLLYIDCFVDWSGRISNEVKTENSEKFTFLVGYEDLKNVQGVVDVQLDFLPVPELDSSRPVRILGRICSDGGKIYLRCKSVYQNIYN